MRIDTTKLVIGVGVVCVLLAVGVWVMREQDGEDIVTDAGARPSPTVNVQATPTGDALAEPSPTATGTTAGKPTPTPKLGYDAALRQFEGRRIQLDPACTAIPSQVTYKNGTQLMLDNRSGESKSVLFNLKRYTIPAYDYIVVAAVADSTPAVTYMDCGQKQNVAKITIQK